MFFNLSNFKMMSPGNRSYPIILIMIFYYNNSVHFEGEVNNNIELEINTIITIITHFDIHFK